MLELLKSGEGKKNWRLGGNNERFGIIVIFYMFQCNINNFKPFSCNQKDKTYRKQLSSQNKQRLEACGECFPDNTRS